MARMKGHGDLHSIYNVTANGPLDTRQVVTRKADLIEENIWSYEDEATEQSSLVVYNGMIVAVVDDTSVNNGIYVLKDKTKLTNVDYSGWSKLADLESISSTEELDKLAEEVAALREEVDMKATQEDLDNLVASLEEAGYVTITKLEEEISKCVVKQDLDNEAEIRETQDNSLAAQIDKIFGDIKFNAADNTKVTVGNLPEGTNLEGRTIGQIITMMLFGATNPEVVEPFIESCTLDLNRGLMNTGYVGHVTIKFNKGSVTPAYNNVEFRSGDATNYFTTGATTSGYELVDENPNEAVLTIEIGTLLPGANNFTVSVTYAAGQVITDSIGSQYMGALPVGTLSTTKGIIGITPSFVGNDVDSIEETALPQSYLNNSALPTTFGYFVTDDGEGYQFTTPDSLVGKPAVVLIPSVFRLTGIQGYNIMGNYWEWLYQDRTASLTEFIEEGTTSKIINGVEVEYTRYVYNIDDKGACGSTNYRFFVEVQ